MYELDIHVLVSVYFRLQFLLKSDLRISCEQKAMEEISDENNGIFNIFFRIRF